MSSYQKVIWPKSSNIYDSWSGWSRSIYCRSGLLASMKEIRTRLHSDQSVISLDVWFALLRLKSTDTQESANETARLCGGQPYWLQELIPIQRRRWDWSFMHSLHSSMQYNYQNTPSTTVSQPSLCSSETEWVPFWLACAPALRSPFRDSGVASSTLSFHGRKSESYSVAWADESMRTSGSILAIFIAEVECFSMEFEGVYLLFINYLNISLHILSYTLKK
jgi:hypothetical protein